MQHEVVTVSLGIRSWFEMVVSVLSTQSEGTERYSHANAKLLQRLEVRSLEVVSDVVRIQFSGCEVVSSANTVFCVFASCSNFIFRAELLNSSTHSERTTGVAYAHTITLFTFTSNSGSSSCRSGGFYVVIANKCFNAYATELASIVNTVNTSSIETTVVIVASYQVGSLVVAGNGVHRSIVTAQQNLTEAAFQTHYGATVETMTATNINQVTICIANLMSIASECTISRVETSFNVEYGRQTVTQVFLTFQAPAGARQVARHQTSCTCFGSSTTLFSFSLNNTVASVNDTVQSYGRLCGSSAHSSQSGNSNQRFFHCKFLQG